ncbi:Vmo1: Vitelline membrane outer layer protein 1-like, partial [Crotalus adamanteus]
MQPLSVALFLVSVCLASAVDRQYISANGTFANRRDYDSITVKNGGRWGLWTWIDKCPPGSYAIGFSIRVNLCAVEEYRGASDDTSLNGIRLFCSTEQSNNIMYTVESEPG